MIIPAVVQYRKWQAMCDILMPYTCIIRSCRVYRISGVLFLASTSASTPSDVDTSPRLLPLDKDRCLASVSEWTVHGPARPARIARRCPSMRHPNTRIIKKCGAYIAMKYAVAVFWARASTIAGTNPTTKQALDARAMNAKSCTVASAARNRCRA